MPPKKFRRVENAPKRKQDSEQSRAEEKQHDEASMVHKPPCKRSETATAVHVESTDTALAESKPVAQVPTVELVLALAKSAAIPGFKEAALRGTLPEILEKLNSADVPVIEKLLQDSQRDKKELWRDVADHLLCSAHCKNSRLENLVRSYHAAQGEALTLARDSVLKGVFNYPVAKLVDLENILAKGHVVDVEDYLEKCINNRGYPGNMVLIGRNDQMEALKAMQSYVAKNSKMSTQKTQLFVLWSSMGTGKTQLLKCAVWQHFNDSCAKGMVLVSDCLNPPDWYKNTFRAFAAATSETRLATLTQVEALVIGLVCDHLRKFFNEKVVGPFVEKGDSAGHTLIDTAHRAYALWSSKSNEYAPLLALDTVEGLCVMTNVACTQGRKENRRFCTVVEQIAKVLPIKSVVAFFGSEPRALSKLDPTCVGLTRISHLEALTFAEYTKALSQSWNPQGEIGEVEKRYTVPLMYHLGGGVPRHLCESAREVIHLRPFQALSSWQLAITHMYTAAATYVGSSQGRIGEEFWTLAVAAATKLPVKLEDCIVGTPKSAGLSYAKAGRIYATVDKDKGGNGTLRVPPVLVDPIVKKLQLPMPATWPNGLDLLALYMPFDPKDLLLKSEWPSRQRGAPYETIIAHSLVGRWWLLFMTRRDANVPHPNLVPLLDLVCIAPTGSIASSLTQYFVDLSDGISTPESKAIPKNADGMKCLVWNMQRKNATHDMLLPLTILGANGKPQYYHTAAVQVRHGNAKTLEDLKNQIKDVKENKLALLLVVHNTAYPVPLPLQQVPTVFVDGSQFSRDDAVYAVAPFTQKAAEVSSPLHGSKKERESSNGL